MAVARGFVTPPYLWKPPILPSPPFSNFVHHPPKPLLPLLFLLPYFFDWIDDHATFGVILLDDIMDLHMSILGTLVPEEPCCVFYTKGIKFTEVWHIMKFLASTLIWYHKQKQRHTTHTRAKRLTHPYKYIYINSTCYVPTAAICISLNKYFLISKICLTDFHTVFALKKLLLCRSHISVD